MLVADDHLARLVAGNATHAALQTAVRRTGTPSMWDSAVAHVRAGATSVSELLRAFDVPADAPPATTAPARTVP